MPKPIRIWFAADARPCWTAYRIGGLPVLATGSIHELEVFARPADVGAAPAAPASLAASELGPAKHVEGWVGGDWLAVEALHGKTGHRLRLGEDLVVDCVSTEDRIDLVVGGERTDDTTRFAVLGPALTLALALDQRFSLHASGFLTARGVVAVAGESGAGKSTFARVADEVGYPRIADDQLIVRPGQESLEVLPRFPQLKLAPERQITRPEALRLAAVVCLRRDRETREPEVRVLKPRRTATRLLEHTTASSLFDRNLRVRHFDFCIDAAEHVTAVDLRMPDDLEAVPAAVRMASGLLEDSGLSAKD